MNNEFFKTRIQSKKAAELSYQLIIILFVEKIGNTPEEDRLLIDLGYHKKTILVAADGEISDGAETPIYCDACCIVQQHDGKLLVLGNFFN